MLIYKKFCEFEDELQRLTASIQQYKPDPEIASEIVVTADKINAELEKIELLHEMRSNQVVKQNTENDQLNESLRSILTTLNDCRQELELLPKLTIEEEQDVAEGELQRALKEPDLDATKQLLAYAMKLSKFSRIPRTFDGFLLPNNFLWPGDDNMRRGMLAMASMMPDKVINRENSNSGQEEIEVEVEEEKKDEESNQVQVNEEEDVLRRDGAQTKDASEVMAGLDLFDEDED
ncbi:hypothetical protein FOA43_003190 [Brettanomyces nanus]|uniref:Mediator of RNA polymerase II transcription subunit 4 n=1 Tax=Eeniella nana TaxID=13502 RepID=A0A875S4F1_EENNA|nr:uncharacterized protein FOA43_003190 [Brettanomyces nanus]QPG75828.1 hypothetical protein FOA43_003190 [Brettanomyces nanus]